MESLRAKKGFICDMDGVIYHGNQLLPGVKEFVEWLQKEEKQCANIHSWIFQSQRCGGR